MSVAQKLDLLLELVNGMNTRIQEQNERLQKQEEKVSSRDVSVLPSAQSSPKANRVLLQTKCLRLRNSRMTPKYKQRLIDIYKLTTTRHESTIRVSQIQL